MCSVHPPSVLYLCRCAQCTHQVSYSCLCRCAQCTHQVSYTCMCRCAQCTHQASVLVCVDVLSAPTRLPILLCVYVLSAHTRCPILVCLDVFCTSETFSAHCSAHQVVIVRRAVYGRLEAGRCITSEYAHAMGCFADVTVYLQDVCSGRQNCTLLVATIDALAQPCGKDFKSYLDITHQCVTG